MEIGKNGAAVNSAAVKEKIWSKAFVNIFIVSFVMSMGQFMMNTLIPKYVYALGGAVTVVGMVTGVFAVTALGIRPIAGPAMDYFKKSRLLSVAFGAITIAFVCYGFSHNIAMLIAARLIHGIGIGLAAPLSLALASNTLPNAKMASGLGIFSLGSAIATAIGPTLGLKLSVTIGYNNTFFICAAVMASCLVLSLFLKAEAPAKTRHFVVRINQVITPEVILPTLVVFFQIIAFSGINSFIAIYGGLCGVEDIGLYFTANALCLIFIRPLSGRIADKYGLDKTIIPGLLIFICALMVISISRTLPMFMLSGVICAVGYGISEPVLQSMNMQLVPKERRGAAGNTNFMGIDVGFLIGPTIAGAIISAVQTSTGSQVQGIAVMYRVMALPVVVSIIIFAVSRKKLLANIKALKEAQEAADAETQNLSD
jgi:MFS family permease